MWDIKDLSNRRDERRDNMQRNKCTYSTRPQRIK